MNKYKNIIEIFKKHSGYARSKDILAVGIHPRDIKDILDKGIIIKVKNGLYRLADTPVISNQSFIDLACAVREGVICLISALSYYELTTFNPSIISMAIRRKAWRPKIKYPPVEFYYFSTKQFEAGIDEIKIERHKIRIYCPEKTPKLKTYSIESIISEKFEAMVKLAMANSRMKDFYDVYSLLLNHNFRGSRLKKAIESTFQRRKTPLPDNPLVFRSEFRKDKGTQKQWVAFLRKSLLSDVNHEFNQIMENITSFLSPIVISIKDRVRMDKIWNPTAGCWKK